MYGIKIKLSPLTVITVSHTISHLPCKMCLCCEDIFCLRTPPREAGFILRNAVGQKRAKLSRHVEVGGDGQAHHKQQDVNPHFLSNWLQMFALQFNTHR